MLVVSWFSCPDTRYCIFLQRLYRRCGFCPFWGRKNVFFRNKNIYDCKRQVNGTYMPNIKFLRQKLWQIKSVQTHRQTDTRTDRSMKTEGSILVTSPCVASYSLHLEWSNIDPNRANLGYFEPSEDSYRVRL